MSYRPPQGFDAPHPGPPNIARQSAAVEPVPAPPEIPTDPVSKQAVYIGYATVTLPALLYNLAEAFDWVHLTDTQFAAVKAIYAFVVFSVAYWTASNVYSKASVAKIRAGKEVA